MMIRDVFRSDVRRAINATPTRRIVSFGSMAVLVVLAVIFGAVASWWVWPMLVIGEGVVFLLLGNHWAGKDALARAAED